MTLSSKCRGIDTVRNKIKMFAQKKAALPPGRHKIVILDEADRYQSCLRLLWLQDVQKWLLISCVPVMSAESQYGCLETPKGCTRSEQENFEDRIVRDLPSVRLAVQHDTSSPAGFEKNNGDIQRHHPICSGLQHVQQNHRAHPEPLRDGPVFAPL